MGYVLKTEGLTKEYDHIKAIDNISLTVNEGDIYGFVGKNGAGKTTLIRAILGLCRVEHGSVSFFDGQDIHTAKKRVGSLVESPSLYTNMTAFDNMRMLTSMLGTDRDKIKEILTTVGLENTGKKKVKDFSLGMKQRLGIAMTLPGDPDFLILDEPINGLDPTGIVEIRELLLRLHEKGITIFVSSHYLGELEKIATRYGIISKGKLIEEISQEELKEKCGSRIVLKTSNATAAKEISDRLLKTDKTYIGSKGELFIEEKVEDIGMLTSELFKNGVSVTGISNDENSAEDYFIKRMEEG